MKAQQLPYDMGNAGDFIKHGLIAEYVEWWLTISKSDFVFLDPFAGRPYVVQPHYEVLRRMQKIPGSALMRGQVDAAKRYYGSGTLVKNITANANRKAVIKVSDRNLIAMEDLLEEGFESIQFDGFDTQESFSIINCEVPANSVSLMLLDPFDDFLPNYAESVVPRLGEFISVCQVPVALFVLCKDWDDDYGSRWQQLRERFQSSSLVQFSLVCPKMPNSNVKGERHFNSESLLLLPNGYY
ncbi:hypothetical protein, partial [Kaarinaea lacus]